MAREVDILVERDRGGGFVAKVRGDRRKPRPVGRGETWQRAVADLRRSEVNANVKGDRR